MEIDPVSAKTLPYLDKLYNDGDMDKLARLVNETAAAPRRRLTLAAIARHTKPAYGDPVNSNVALLLEELIDLNLSDNGESANVILDVVGSAETLLLTVSIIRYNIYDSPLQAL